MSLWKYGIEYCKYTVAALQQDYYSTTVIISV